MRLCIEFANRWPKPIWTFITPRAPDGVPAPWAEADRMACHPRGELFCSVFESHGRELQVLSLPRIEGEREFERSRRFRLTRLAEAEEEEEERSLRCFARPFFAGRSSDSDSDSFLAFLRFSFFSFFSGFFRSRFFFLSSEASLSPPSSSENARIFDFPMCSLPRLGRVGRTAAWSTGDATSEHAAGLRPCVPARALVNLRSAL